MKLPFTGKGRYPRDYPSMRIRRAFNNFRHKVLPGVRDSCDQNIPLLGGPLALIIQSIIGYAFRVTNESALRHEVAVCYRDLNLLISENKMLRENIRGGEVTKERFYHLCFCIDSFRDKLRDRKDFEYSDDLRSILKQVYYESVDKKIR